MQPPPQPGFPGEPYQPPGAQSPYYPFPQPARPPQGRIRWLVVIGGAIAFSGTVMIGVVYLWLAAIDVSTINSFDSIRWT